MNHRSSSWDLQVKCPPEPTPNPSSAYTVKLPVRLKSLFSIYVWQSPSVHSVIFHFSPICLPSVTTFYLSPSIKFSLSKGKYRLWQTAMGRTIQDRNWQMVRQKERWEAKTGAEIRWWVWSRQKLKLELTVATSHECDGLKLMAKLNTLCVHSALFGKWL